MSTKEAVQERRRKRRERKLKEKMWEAAYDLAEMGVGRDTLEGKVRDAHRQFHKNVAEFGDPSRKRPFPSHDWPEGYDAGPPQTCETCGAEWAEGYEDPPPWKCRSEPMERSQGVRARNPERMKRRRYSEGVKHTYGPYFEWTAERSCFACGAYPCVPHHVEKVGNGGRDPENLLDTCHDCHTRIEQEGVEAWGEAVGISHPRKRLEARTSELWRLYRRERPEEAERLMEVVG